MRRSKQISKCSKEFGFYIRTWRERKNLYQQEVADMVGVTQSYYSLIENGQREIDLSLALRICIALDLDLSDFVKKYI